MKLLLIHPNGTPLAVYEMTDLALCQDIARETGIKLEVIE